MEHIEHLGKLPPQSTDIEKAVLGALMIEKKDAIIMDILKPEMFYKIEHQNIFQAIFDLSFSKQPIDFFTVIEQLKSNGKLDESGGPEFVISLSQNIGSAAHIESHSMIIAEKYMMRELIRMSSEITKRAFDDTEDIEGILTDAGKQLINIQNVITGGNILSLGECLSLTLKQNQNIKQSIKTGFPSLDEKLYISDDDYIILAARPSQGKTALALNIALKKSEETPVLFFSMEMSYNRITNRLLSNEGEIPHDYFQTKLYNNNLKEAEEAGQRLYDRCNMFIDDTGGLSITKLRAKIMQAKLKYKIGFVVVDYLQLMNEPGFGSNDNSRVSHISRQLKAMTREFKIPFLVLSQLSRDITKGSFRRPKLSDLRDSGSIEQDADTVVFLINYKKSGIDVRPDGMAIQPGECDIDISKHRNGECWQGIPIIFKGKYQKFIDTKEF